MSDNKLQAGIARRATHELSKDELRERLGRVVRAEWVAWAKEQPAPKPHWLAPWEDLAEPDREVDRRIGERIFNDALKEIATRSFGDPDVHARALDNELRLHTEAELVQLRAENARLQEDLATILAERDGFCMIAGNATAEVARLRAVLSAILGAFVVGSELPDSYRFTAKITFTAGEHRELSAALATNTTQPGREDDAKR